MVVWRNRVLCGDAVDVLGGVPDGFVDCVVTSPPYFGLRDYGVDGQIGLEDSPEKYVERLMGVFSECKRVLKKSGTFWLNIGDTYGGSMQGYGAKGKSQSGFQDVNDGFYAASHQKPPMAKLQPKCLLMMPERLAMTLINDGWILRNKIIWNKPNAMPSSVKDRFSNKYEFVYFFSKSKRYWFDLDAVREKHKSVRPNGKTD